MNNQEKEVSQNVKRLPPPIPGVEVVIPLALWPAYMKLHKIEPLEYKPDHEVLIVKRTDSNG